MEQLDIHWKDLLGVVSLCHMVTAGVALDRWWLRCFPIFQYFAILCISLVLRLYGPPWRLRDLEHLMFVVVELALSLKKPVHCREEMERTIMPLHRISSADIATL
jgi:hypothetical protein